MAGKRTATSELNHDNWDDYEPEDAGTYKKASDEVLKRRVIRTAKRRNPISSLSSSPSEGDSPAKNVFSNFGGFVKSSSNQSSPSPFAYLSNLTNSSAQSNTNGLNSSTSVTKSTNSHKLVENNSQNVSEDKKISSEKSVNYYGKLRGLNESVSQWIKTHVDKNPLCILTPIFQDYEKYLTEIQNTDTPEQKTEPSTESKTHTSTVFGNSVATTPSENPFLSTNTDDKSKEPEKLTPFSFGSTKKPEASGFMFGTGGTPFTFSNVAKPQTTETSSKRDENGEEDEPPMVEFKPVVEDGNVYSKRCKVFVKKDGNFGDRGVGQLYLKPVSGSDKMQLIVRADTNLGNLLLNFILSDGIPLQRMGKNNVMMVCIPTPEAKPPPVPVLLRVKSTDEADELLKVLEKHKK